MSSFSISERLGVVLLGFAIYDAVRGSWSIGLIKIANDDFNLTRGILVTAICFFIVSSLTISHKMNSDVFSNTNKKIPEQSQKLVKQNIKSVLLSVIFAFMAIGLAYLGMGPRQAFLVWIGLGFVNCAPLANRLVSK